MLVTTASKAAGHAEYPEALAKDHGVVRVARRIRRETGARTAPLGLNPHQARALRMIGNDGPLRPSEVAEQLGIVARSATDAVSGLVTAGLVENDAPTRPTGALSCWLSPPRDEPHSPRRRRSGQRWRGTSSARFPKPIGLRWLP